MLLIEIGFYSVVLCFVVIILKVFLPPEKWTGIHEFLEFIALPLFGGGFIAMILGAIIIGINVG